VGEDAQDGCGKDTMESGRTKQKRTPPGYLARRGLALVVLCDVRGGWMWQAKGTGSIVRVVLCGSCGECASHTHKYTHSKPKAGRRARLVALVARWMKTAA